MDALTPIKHKVIECGYAVMLIEEDPKWIFPTASFSVAFHSDPNTVLKYGSNGLHFAEHILWNMIANGTLQQTNASTFSTGEMAVYGSCTAEALRASMEKFFSGLMDLAKCNQSKEMRKTYEIEQRRVTCETSHMRESSMSAGGREKMFVFNTDMVRSKFPVEYVWKILLEESALGRVVVMAHCHVEDEDQRLFSRLANEFTKAWDERHKFVPKSVKLPLYFAPPYSMLCDERTKEEETKFAFPDDVNPIERVIIALAEHATLSPYPFSMGIRTRSHGMRRHRDRKLVGRAIVSYLEFEDPYFAIPLLSSYRGPLSRRPLDASAEHSPPPGSDPRGGDEATDAAVWLDDLYSLSPQRIVTKYYDAAMDKAKGVLSDASAATVAASSAAASSARESGEV